MRYRASPFAACSADSNCGIAVDPRCRSSFVAVSRSRNFSELSWSIAESISTEIDGACGSVADDNADEIDNAPANINAKDSEPIFLRDTPQVIGKLNSVSLSPTFRVRITFAAHCPLLRERGGRGSSGLLNFQTQAVDASALLKHCCQLAGRLVDHCSRISTIGESRIDRPHQRCGLTRSPK